MMPAHVVSQSKFEEWTKTQKPFFEVNKDKIQAWLAARNLSTSTSKGGNDHAAFNGEDTTKKDIKPDSNYTKVESATHNIADNKAMEGKQ